MSFESSLKTTAIHPCPTLPAHLSKHAEPVCLSYLREREREKEEEGERERERRETEEEGEREDERREGVGERDQLDLSSLNSSAIKTFKKVPSQPSLK